MFQPVSFFIGLRYSRSRSRTGFISFITFFSIAGILLGIASLITVVSVMNGFEGELKKRILGLVPHVVLSAKTNKVNIDLPPPLANNFNWQEERAALLTQPHVMQVTPFVETEALVQSPYSLKGILIQGIIPQFELDNIINKSITSGSLSSLTSSKYNLVLGLALARKLKVNLGDKVRLVLPTKMHFTPMGRIPVQRNFTVTGIFNIGSQVDDSVVYIHSQDAARLLRKRGDGITQLRLYLDDAFNAQKVAANIKATNINASGKSQFQIDTWDDSQGVLFSAVKMEKNMMWLMLSLIVAVAAFNIVSALVMVVIEKQGEIAILQTLGLNRFGIVKIFITQGMINGLWGSVLGTLLGLMITLNINDVIAFFGVNLFGAGYATQILPTQIEIENVITILLAALLMSFIATLYPAYSASKTLPAEVLRNE